MVAHCLFMAALAAPAPVPVPDVVRYELHVRLDPSAKAIHVQGSGGGARFEFTKTIDHPIDREGEDYARGFAATAGTIQPDGVFLGGASGWYPAPPEGSLVTFSLEVALPAGWDAMSQGRRTVHERSADGTRVTFVADDPQEEIWLVAGPWSETSRPVEGIEAMTFLRAADDAPGLASRYLDATGPYVAMYAKLLGTYPYSKFALVENFWETGYGMPSFTLLGGRVLRLPFIVTTSYPHEILHNWWGNGVYVTKDGGNWSEGLTAYLADHLMAERNGGGAAYRQEALQKYADYVSRSKEMPLSEFRERHSPSSEAIGYGKALMLFHMVRREIGDAAFVKGLRSFYAEMKFKRAGFGDLRRAFEAAAGRPLAGFDPMVARAGAPRLRVSEVVARAAESGSWRVTGTIEQSQSGDPFPLAVPMAITMEGTPDALPTIVRTDAKRAAFDLAVPGRPVRLDVDPEFDLFRMLDVEEAPPALSGAFGAETATLVLPSRAPSALLHAYRAMAGEWNNGRTAPMTIVADDAIETLPAAGSLWIVGYENRFAPSVTEALAAYGAAASPDRQRARALVARRAPGAAPVIAFVAADRAAQVPGLGRKLPHYHKYSYLAFEGDEPVNVDKGRWPVTRSPMTALLDGAPPIAKLASRQALAELPPAFSKERLLGTARRLAAPEMKGRGAGSAELARAGASIAAAMKEAGLEVLPIDPAVGNVIGVLRGTKADWADQSVVIGAHYDHLGEGHPGADDNASGVAVLLELARQMAGSAPGRRTAVFAAFAGEETGLTGSKAYVATAAEWPAAKAIGMVNLDTVGRLGSGPILVLGTSTADEWVHIANGAGYVTGAPVKAVPNDPGGSDQNSFLAAGVPAVQLFTGAHADYHGAGDTADKLDGDGMVKVAGVAREFVAYLAERDRPLTARLGRAPAAGPASGGSERRATLGTIPDYAFAGPGVRLSGTMPDSPAARAGLRAGDVLVKIDSATIGSMRDLSDVLKTLAPGSEVVVAFLRDGRSMTVKAVLASR